MAAGVLLLIIVSFLFLRTGKVKNTPTVFSPDLSIHPIYSKYQFKNEDKVINIGVQPLYLPTGLISESMKRDNILQNALLQLGMKANYFAFLKGDDVNFFLRRKDLDLGVGGDMPAISAAATLDVIVPAMIQKGFISIIANRPMFINELRGKRIGYAFGSNAHYALLSALASENVVESEVELIPMETPEMIKALYAKKIDAFSAWEPTPTIAIKLHPDFVVLHQRLTTGYIYFFRSFSGKYPDAVGHIVAAVIRSMRWMQTQEKNFFQACEWAKKASKELSGQDLPLTTKEIAELAMAEILGMTSLPIISLDDLEQNGLLNKEYRFLRTLGKIPSSSSWERVRDSFNRRIIIEVINNPEKFELDKFDYNMDADDN